MEQGYTHGRMVEGTKASTYMIRKMVTVFIPGQMEEVFYCLVYNLLKEYEGMWANGK
jgi:hypothetical protein